LHGASRFASEPCLWFRNTLPRSPSDNTGVLSESHPDLELFNQYPSLEQVTTKRNLSVAPHTKENMHV